jgi:hypothetical protein
VARLPALAAALLALAVLAAPARAAEAVTEDDAIVVINGDVTVERTEAAKGVYIAHGDAHIAGFVDGDVVVLNGDATVSGRIDGDLVALTGRARLLPRANVTGDIAYADERPRIAPTATVGGKVEKADWGDWSGAFPLIGAFVLWLAMSISAAVLGILLLLIAPRAADAAFERAKGRVGPVIAIGIAIFIVLPVAAFLAAITLVGLPLALALGLALLPLAAVAYVTSAWALGRAIVKPPRERILAFLAGLAILRAIALVPILGLLVWLAAVIFGLGLLGAAIGAAREPAPARAPGS